MLAGRLVVVVWARLPTSPGELIAGRERNVSVSSPVCSFAAGRSLACKLAFSLFVNGIHTARVQAEELSLGL